MVDYKSHIVIQVEDKLLTVTMGFLSNKKDDLQLYIFVLLEL